MTVDPLYAALMKERYASSWWVTDMRVDKKHERDVEKALAEAIDRLDRYETKEVA